MDTATAFAPSLSVIIVFPDGYESRRHAISHVAAQTVAAQLELVMVIAADVPFAPDKTQLAPFGSYQILTAPQLDFPGQGFAMGVRSARSPLVAYVEEHSFPEPQWAESLIRAHAGPYAAVGSTMGNANPETLCSWVSLYSEFGPIVTPAVSHVTTYLGGHHTSYKRDVLLAYEGVLETTLENETALHIELRERGHILYLEGAAVSNHQNISKPLAFMRQSFSGQRSFAATRAKNWSLLNRGLYLFAAPLIPVVRFIRILKEMQRTHRAAQLIPGTLPLLFCSLTYGTLGEAIGYLFGDTSENIRIRAEAEFDREPFLSERLQD